MEFYDFEGELYGNLDSSSLQYEVSKKLLAACLENKHFEVIELRKINLGGLIGIDAIIVTCGDGTVSSRNLVGIKVEERFALLYSPELAKQYNCPHDVRALRKDFPKTFHQNYISSGEPCSLCLYFEPWSLRERSWTPQQHLNRILWWLHEISRNTLHRHDQPLEQMYFSSPYKMVLPHDFDTQTSNNQKFVFVSTSKNDDIKNGLIRGYRVENYNQQLKTIEGIVIDLPFILHGAPQLNPSTLGELEEQLVQRNSGLINALIAKIKEKVTSRGVDLPATGAVECTLLILRIPVVREIGMEPESVNLDGFFIGIDFGRLGIAAGALIQSPNERKAYSDSFGSSLVEEAKEWRNLSIFPISIHRELSQNDARIASGISMENANFKGVLAGVGALGSALAELWSREAWGNWIYVDDDLLMPHNIVRHTAKNCDIGVPKAEVVKDLSTMNFSPNVMEYRGIIGKIADRDNEDIAKTLREADLLIDATTTLEAPRDLCEFKDVPRLASVFLTTSGMDSVLLIEDKDRTIHLSSLEPQYYRSILREEWGETHLKGHMGEIWVGGGCRDLSMIISPELINLHSSILARQIRKKSCEPDASICIWSLNDENSQIHAYNVSVYPMFMTAINTWKIVWDKGLQDTFYTLRASSIPNETGGILLGYFDYKIKVLYLVEALAAPQDSVQERSSFIRGKNGLSEVLQECSRRTANIVYYVGEWHSHPDGIPSTPSQTDTKLFEYLTEQMKLEGSPTLMAIIGEKDISFFLSEVE